MLRSRSFLLLLVLLSLAGCVSTGPKHSQKEVMMDVNLSTKGNDIAFDVKSLQVPKGKTVKLRFTNRADKESEILHNIAVLKPNSIDKVLKDFENMDYDVEKMKSHGSVLAMTPSLNPGQEAVLTLDAKKIAKPGYYPYVCLIPGHADVLGMKGILHVK